MTGAGRRVFGASAAGSVRVAKLDRSTAHRGVNVAGAEFGSVGQAHGVGYRWPTQQDLAFVAARGFTLVRVPFLWERVQPSRSAALDADEQARMVGCVAAARAAGLVVVLDMHNYGKHNGEYLGATPGPTLSDFTDVWLRLSALFKGDATVVGYGLMNEPNGMPTVGQETGRDRWTAWSQAVVSALRAAGDPTAVMVSGYNFGSIATWLNTSSGTPSPWITDPLDNVLYEGHQYWDSGGGTYPNTYAQEQTANSGWGGPDPTLRHALNDLRAWINWLRVHNVRGFVGEFGWPRVVGVTTGTDSTAWNAVAEQWMRIVDAAGPVVWTAAWATGSFWAGSYNLRLYANDGAGQLSTLLENAATLEAHRARRGESTPMVKTRIAPVDYGQRWRAFSTDPATMTSTGTLPTGNLYVAMLEVQDIGRLESLLVYVSTVASSPTAGQCLAGLFDVVGQQLAVSGDIGSEFAALGVRTLDLTSPTRVFRPGERLYAALLFNGTTGPVLGRAGTTQGLVNVLTRRWGQSSTTMTSMPATISPGSLVATNSAFWVAGTGS